MLFGMVNIQQPAAGVSVRCIHDTNTGRIRYELWMGHKSIHYFLAYVVFVLVGVQSV